MTSNPRLQENDRPADPSAVPSAGAYGGRSAAFGLALSIAIVWPLSGMAQDSDPAQGPDAGLLGDPIDILPEDGANGEAEREEAGDVVTVPPSALQPSLDLEPLPGITQSEMDEIRTSLSGEADGADGEAGNSDAGEGARTPFRIGIVPRGDSNRFLKRLQPMRDGLGDLLDRPVEILPMTSYSAMINAHTLRRIDLGFYSASAFVAADRLCRCVEPLVMPLADDGTSEFYAIIVSRQDSAIRSVSDLEGKRIAASSAASVAGYRMQVASLVRDGIEPDAFFEQIDMVGSGAEALRQVRDGLVDAAFVWSSMNGNLASGYSRGPLNYLVGTGELEMDDVSIIWQSKPIAHAPVVGLKSFSAQERKAVQTYLLALPESDTATYDLLDIYYGGGFRTADIAD
ncbi:MAG TPA: phosphate/phosphite/phosphonate ABC transporter substrate-binding protein, partial [Afifellaceae bacterium]|nr:phosphate/phosphite/phosphonate ABC transporter substrate-binding protein [Afifellaceae bacterium]